MFLLIHLLNLLSIQIGSYSINVFPNPLDKNEEEKLLKEASNGNKEARNILIEHNLRLVAHIVKKYEYYKELQDDLISIGTIGLIKGIDSFKLDKKNKLTTYVSRCIENEILMYFRSNKKNNNNVSLSDSIGIDKDGNEINLIDVICENNPEYLEKIHNKEIINNLKEYINILSEREKLIIEKRYGLNDQDEMTQIEVSNLLNISRSYVSRLEKKALNKLLKEFKKHKKEL